LSAKNVAISTPDSEFNKWHLAEFARFYGASIFRNNYVLELLDIEECNIQFRKPIKSETIIVENKWNKSIEFKTFYLNCAEAYQTNVLANSLSESAIIKLNEKHPGLNLTKNTFKHSRDYAYQVINDVLIIVNYDRESEKCKINYLSKIEWNEK